MSWLARADAPHRCVMPAQLGNNTDGAIWRCDACGICWRLNLPITRDPRAASWTRLPDEQLVGRGHAVLPGSACWCDGPQHSWSPGWCPSSGPVTRRRS